MSTVYRYYVSVHFSANGFGGLEVVMDVPVTTYAAVVELRHRAARIMKHPADDLVILNYVELTGDAR